LNNTNRTTRSLLARKGVLWLLTVSAVALFVLTGCAGTSTPQGWSGAAVSDDKLYIGSQDRDVRALDIETGQTVWTFDLRGEEESDRAVYGTPAISEGLVYVGGYDGILYALNLGDGQESWDKVVGEGAPIVGGPVVGDGLVLVGSGDGTLYAFHADTGTQEWKFTTDKGIWSTPTIANGRAYVGSLDQKLYALNLSDGVLMWDFPTGGAITAQPLVVDGRVYIGSFSSNFYAIDAETGTRVWEFPGASNWYWGGAVAEGGKIFAASTDSNLYALDSSSGQLLWVLDTDASIIGSPTLIGDRVAVASTDGRVRLVKQQDGTDETQCNIRTTIKSPLASHNGSLFFRAEDHTIRALKINVNGNPDEVWIHQSNDQENPVPRDWTKSC